MNAYVMSGGAPSYINPAGTLLPGVSQLPVASQPLAVSQPLAASQPLAVSQLSGALQPQMAPQIKLASPVDFNPNLQVEFYQTKSGFLKKVRDGETVSSEHVLHPIDMRLDWTKGHDCLETAIVHCVSHKLGSKVHFLAVNIKAAGKIGPENIISHYWHPDCPESKEHQKYLVEIYQQRAGSIEGLFIPKREAFPLKELIKHHFLHLTHRKCFHVLHKTYYDHHDHLDIDLEKEKHLENDQTVETYSHIQGPETVEDKYTRKTLHVRKDLRKSAEKHKHHREREVEVARKDLDIEPIRPRRKVFLEVEPETVRKGGKIIKHVGRELEKRIERGLEERELEKRIERGLERPRVSREETVALATRIPRRTPAETMRMAPVTGERTTYPSRATGRATRDWTSVPDNLLRGYARIHGIPEHLTRDEIIGELEGM